jgi:hypothetical protein
LNVLNVNYKIYCPTISYYKMHCNLIDLFWYLLVFPPFENISMIFGLHLWRILNSWKFWQLLDIYGFLAMNGTYILLHTNVCLDPVPQFKVISERPVILTSAYRALGGGTITTHFNVACEANTLLIVPLLWSKRETANLLWCTKCGHIVWRDTNLFYSDKKTNAFVLIKFPC